MYVCKVVCLILNCRDIGCCFFTTMYERDIRILTIVTSGGPGKVNYRSNLTSEGSKIG